MEKTTLHGSAAPRRGVIPPCRGGGTAARPRAPPRCRSFAAHTAAVSPIRFRSPPFKREYEYLNKHLAIHQLLLFTARRHSPVIQRAALNAIFNSTHRVNSVPAKDPSASKASVSLHDQVCEGGNHYDAHKFIFFCACFP